MVVLTSQMFSMVETILNSLQSHPRSLLRFLMGHLHGGSGDVTILPRISSSFGFEIFIMVRVVSDLTSSVCHYHMLPRRTSNYSSN